MAEKGYVYITEQEAEAHYAAIGARRRSLVLVFLSETQLTPLQGRPS